MRTLRAAALAGLTLAALAMPGTARAGTVAAGLSLTYTAAPGDADRLAITRGGDRIVFTETGGRPIAEGAPACDGGGTPVVSCAAAPAPAAVEVALGDGADQLQVGPLGGALRVTVDGGDGGDALDAAAATGYVVLAGGGGADALAAGAGESDLDGGPGADTLVGGPEDATTTYLMGAAPDGADAVVGGPGFDIAGYSGRGGALRLTADGVADDGEAGEGDDLGPQIDRLEGGGARDVLSGASGLDAELLGGPGADVLTGGSGNDLLAGGDGDDALSGGAGDDVAAPSDPIGVPEDETDPAGGQGSTSDPGADAFAGGPGFDTTSYGARSAPVKVTLDGVADDGENGERDNAGTDVEAIDGGSGPDILSGRAGAQRITGGAGGDTIDAGPGLDEVRADAGDDTVRARDGIAEWVTCGQGTDTMSGDVDDVPVGCERTTLAAGADHRRPRVKLDSLPRRPRYRHVRRGLRPRLTADEPVSYVVELRGVAKSAHISAAPYNLTLVRKTLKRTARPRRVTLRPRIALLGPRRKLRVRVRVTAKDAAGNVRVIGKTITARR